MLLKTHIDATMAIVYPRHTWTPRWLTHPCGWVNNIHDAINACAQKLHQTHLSWVEADHPHMTVGPNTMMTQSN